MSHEGYVYCMSNEHMPNFLKIGYTDRTPEERLAEANADTWSIPVWRCEMSCRVKVPREVEKILHQLLGRGEGRVSARREFFRSSIDEVRGLFDLLKTQNVIEEASPSPSLTTYGCRESKKCFRDGQLLKHTYKGDECIAIYKAERDIFVWRGTEYSSLARLNAAHKQMVNPELKSAGNAWDEWTCMTTDGIYIPVKNLPEIQVDGSD